MTCFWRELALGTFVNRAFSSVKLRHPGIRTHTRAGCWIKCYQDLQTPMRQQQKSKRRALLHMHPQEDKQLSEVKSREWADVSQQTYIWQTEGLLPQAFCMSLLSETYTPATGCCQEIVGRYIPCIILSFNANLPLPANDDKAISNSAVSEAK